MPSTASTSSIWRAASSFWRNDSPATAVVPFRSAKLPPSKSPLPWMVRRIGIPSPAIMRLTWASSPRRPMPGRAPTGPMRQMMAPPGTITPLSRVNIALGSVGEPPT